MKSLLVNFIITVKAETDYLVGVSCVRVLLPKSIILIIKRSVLATQKIIMLNIGIL